MIGDMHIMQSGEFLPKHPYKIQGRKEQSEFDFVIILGKKSIECIHDNHPISDDANLRVSSQEHECFLLNQDGSIDTA